MSRRVTSSVNIPPECSNRLRRSVLSATANRSAIPGRCHTGSIAALLVTDLKVDQNGAVAGKRGRAMLRELVARMPEIEQAGPIERLRSSSTGGVKSLPVRYRLSG